MPLKFWTQLSTNTRMHISKQLQLQHMACATELKVKRIRLSYTQNLGKNVTLTFLGQLSGFGTTCLPKPLLFSNTVQQVFPEQKRQALRPKSLHFPLKNNMQTKMTMIFPYCHHKREVIFSTADKQNIRCGNAELCFQTDFPVCTKYKEYFG